MNILLGITGSVATTLYAKIHAALKEAGHEVKTIATQRAFEFVKPFDLENCYIDSDEWKQTYQKGDNILHIELRKWANALVIAPLSANTLAKMANGLCDNLLTSVVRAWDPVKPMILAPAMNSYMWDNMLTEQHLYLVRRVYGATIVNPVSKTLACGDTGIGALAKTESIAAALTAALRWKCPIANCRGIPTETHPGAFGIKRKHVHHCGIDLYCEDGALVTAAEKGTIVNFEPFTGPDLGHPWWEPTSCILIRGTSGVICYGEISPHAFPTIRPQIGSFVEKGEPIAYVKRVLKPHKYRPDIPGHSTSMLHLELYSTDLSERAVKTVDWPLDAPKEPKLCDPTYQLLACDIGSGAFPKKLVMP